MEKKKINLEVALPFLILAVMLGIFAISTQGKIFSLNSMKSLIQQTLSLIIASLGMLFVAAIGGCDISQGSLAGLCAAITAFVASEYSIPLAVILSVMVGLLSGLFLGFVNAKLRVPSFMVSLAMMIALRAMVSSVLGNKSVILPAGYLVLDNFAVIVPVVIILIAIITYVFHYTPFGIGCQAIGENERAVMFTGINVTKLKIGAYAMSGLMTGIAAVFILARVGGSSNVIGMGFEMRIMTAIYIGGIPVTGGFASKAYKVVVGAFIIQLLENGLLLSNVAGSVTQLIRGFVLLFVVFIMVKAFRHSKAAGSAAL